MQGGILRPQTFDDLVALVLRNSERLDLLEDQLRRLQEWIAAYPPDGAREAWAALVRTEVDDYRVTAEKALKELAAAIHVEIETLRSGMTEGAQDALADVSQKIQLIADMHKRTQANQAELLDRLQAVATTQEQGAVFDAGIERLVTTYQGLWEEQKAAAEAERAAQEAIRAQRAQSEAREKAARLGREQRRAAQSARLYRLAQSLAVPVLMSAIGTPLALLTSISNTLPQRDVVLLSVVIFVLGCGFAFYWAVVRRPPVDRDTEERLTDTLPSLAPAEGSLAPPASAAPSITTTTTTVTTPAPPAQEPPP
jgi:hypothetical protein